VLVPLFKEISLDLIDFKLEFGKDSSGKLFLADEFTPDGCRLWDLNSKESMDKDRFRQDLGKVEEAYIEVHQRLQDYFKKEKA
jgi:phosphoribosylaminoimidazole-succinocarboxamide synthase